MVDLTWMLTSMLGGAAITLPALATSPALGLTGALVSGWAMCQRDSNYRRVNEERERKQRGST